MQIRETIMRRRMQELLVTTAKLSASIGDVFCGAFNGVLYNRKLDNFAEALCGPFYKEGGHRNIPPGIYFLMILVGSFTGIDSRQDIAWQCAGSLSLRKFHRGWNALEHTGTFKHDAHPPTSSS